MNDNTWFIIVNPISGNKYFQKKEQMIRDSFKALKNGFTVSITSFCGHEEELVQEALKKGYHKFISVGGDGTLHHVVNGIMKYGPELSTKIKVGVIPIGTGNDWIKNYSIPTQINECISILNKEETVFQDLGKITMNNQVYYFSNLAGVGFDGHVVNQINTFRKLGKLSYFIASLWSLATYKKKKINYQSKEKSDSNNMYLLAIGLCRYCGNGMQLTHNPNPTDGLFDITAVKDISTLGFLWNIRKMFNQKLNEHSKVDTFKCSEISITCDKTSTLLMQADGELLSFDSAHISIIPEAFQVVVPKIE